MSETNARGNGRKHPSGPAASEQPKKKAKKLSSVAKLALLALESDSEGSNNSEDEGGVIRDFENNENEKLRSLAISRTAGDPAVKPTINLDDNVVTADGNARTIAKTGDAGDDAAEESAPIRNDNDKTKNYDYHCAPISIHGENSGSIPTEDASKRNKNEMGKNTETADRDDAEGSAPNGDKTGGEKSRSHQCAAKPNNEENEVVGSSLEKDAGERDESEMGKIHETTDNNLIEELWRADDTEEFFPQSNKTNENGIISESDDSVKNAVQEPGGNSLATDEDIVCPHPPSSELNDILSSFLSTPFDDKAMITLHRMKESISGNDSFQSWASSHKDQVPILPQKEFILVARGRSRATTKPQGESLQSPINRDTTSPMPSAIMNAEVTSFLLEEGQKLIDSSNNVTIISNQQQSPHKYPPPPPPSPIQRPPTQQLQSPSQQIQPPNYHGYTQQQNSYYQTPVLNTYNTAPKVHHGYQHNNRWHYPQHYAAPAAHPPAGPGRNYEYNNYSHASSAPATRPVLDIAAPMQHPAADFQPQTNATLWPSPKVARASPEIKLTDSNAPNVAKLPVAFGFSLHDNGASKNSARIAMQKWTADGNSFAAWKGYTEGATKKGGVSGLKRKNNATPPRRTANESLDDSRRSKKRSTSPVPEPAGSGFPEGWTSKTFERITRIPSRAGTYKVFHSPVINAKFRSRKSAYVFIEILKEPRINADEEKAFEVFKSRGHKL